MKICLISNVFHAQPTCVHKVGGAEVCVERIAHQLQSNGHSVVIITQRPFRGLRSLLPTQQSQSGYRIYSFYPLNIFSIYHAHKKSYLLKGVWRIIDLVNIIPAFFIRKIIDAEKPDIINNHIIHGFSPLALLPLIKRSGIPLVQTIHSYGFICPKCDLLRSNNILCTKQPFTCRIFKNLSRFFITAAPDFLIFPSRFCQELYASYGFFRRCKTAIIPSPIETFPANPHCTSKDVFSILYAGRLTKIKGVHVLLAAFKTLPYPHAQLRIAGEGSYEHTLRTLAQGDPRITFLGKKTQAELRTLYATSDLLAVPSIYYEILGNVILESMSCGTPVVASTIGGIPEIVQDHVTGLLIKPHSSMELQTALTWCIEHPRELAAMGKTAFTRSQKFDTKHYVHGLEKEYQKLLPTAG